MCSFVGMRIEKDCGEEDWDTINQYILNCLGDRGGDATNIMIHRYDSNQIQTISLETISSFIYELKKVSPASKPLLSRNDVLFGFSRLTPEMEKTGAVRVPPYKTIFNKYVAAHGTIPLKDLDMDIIDTEILKFDESILDSIEKIEKLNGKVALIEYNSDRREFIGVHNGLGLSTIELPGLFKAITNTDWDFEFKRNIIYNVINPYDNIILTDVFELRNRDVNEKEIVVSLCSGGMDAILSTETYIIENEDNIEAIELNYFDWGTRAVNDEIGAIETYFEHLVNKYGSSINDINREVIYAKDYFKEILTLAGMTGTRLTDKDAVGKGEDEAEEAISYVPLRNTYLLMALAAKFEQVYPNRKVTFIIGANLTEGMVYSDNSVNYINKINALIKLVGQKTSKFKIVAPFAKMTKTKMLDKCLKIMTHSHLEFLIDHSFSCYFPIEGNGDKHCGKCGSCLLKSTAIKRSELSNTKGE